MITFITEDHVTESDGKFITEASSLGHRAGEPMPMTFSTDLGNGMAFRFLRLGQGEAWIFRQAGSGRELHILND